MSNQFNTQMNEAAYKSMLDVNPGVIEALKRAMKNGRTAKQIEKSFRRKYGDGNLTAMSSICAAYHLEAHPELLNSSMRAILIDPVKLEVKEVKIGDDYKEIYKFIEADTFECIQINKDGDLLYIDEEGMFKNFLSQRVFIYAGIPQPIIGKALILGNNKRTGAARDAVITLDQVSKAVSFP